MKIEKLSFEEIFFHEHVEVGSEKNGAKVWENN